MKREELVKLIYRKKTIDRYKNKIEKLGINNKNNMYVLLNIRFFTSILLFTVLLYISKFGYILAPIALYFYFKLFDYIVLDLKIKKRTTIMEKEAIHFFEVLTLSVDTGRNLLEAIKITTSNVSGELSTEFSESLRQVKYGKSLNEAISDMQKRIPSENINNIILLINQSNLFGNSVIDNLYEQVDYLREKRKMEVKARIAKLPVKISIISVFFFVPLMLLIILGPIILSYID